MTLEGLAAINWGGGFIIFLFSLMSYGMADGRTDRIQTARVSIIALFFGLAGILVVAAVLFFGYLLPSLFKDAFKR